MNPICLGGDNAFQIDMDLFNKISDLFNNNRFNKLNKFKVTFDNYLTGEAVVSSLKTRSTINSITTQNTPAGDMEGYGVFKECNRSDFKVPCLVIKSICDWGAEKNFDTSNETTIATFKSIVKSIPDSKTTDEIKQLVSTLEDRIQAYSVSCAFKVLDIMMQYCELKKSLLNELREWFLLCDSGKTYVENLMHEFEFFSNRISNSHNCLYLYDSINEIDTIITEVYNAVSRCCDNSNKLRKKYKKALNINDDEYLSLPIHPITYRSSPQLHTERIIFSHIAYLNRVRLYFVNKNVTNEFEKRKIYNTLFVNHIKNYLTLYGGKILPIYAHRERIYNELFEIVKDIEKATNNNDVDIMFKSILLINL